MKAKKKILSVLLYLCVITKADVKDALLSCTFTAATEKDTAKLDYVFAENVDLNMLTHIRVTRDGMQGDVINCERQDGRVTCRSLTDGVQSEGLMDRHLILRFPNLTSDLQGVYKLRAVVNATSLAPVNCTVSVAERNVAGNESKETTLSLGAIIGIGVGLVVIILLVILVIVGLKRGVKCQSPRNTQDTGKTSEPLVNANTTGRNSRVDTSPLPKYDDAKAVFSGDGRSKATTEKVPPQKR